MARWCFVADAEKAVLRTIATETASFVLLNIFYLPVEPRDVTCAFSTNTATVNAGGQINMMYAPTYPNPTTVPRNTATLHDQCFPPLKRVPFECIDLS